MMGAWDESGRRAAWHEAGHTVIARLYGRVVNRVSLTETDLDRARINAILNATDTLSPADEEYCAQELKIAVAGYAGEVLQFGDGLARAAYRPDAALMRIVQRALKQRAGRVMRSRDILPEVITVLRLKKNEEARGRIATELLALRPNDSLSGAQVRTIIGW